MSYMSYCIIEGATIELSAALEKMRDKDDSELSETELASKKRLISLCKDVVEEFAIDSEEEE
jgi:hypothetical protein